MHKNPKANSTMTQWRRVNVEKSDKYNKDYYKDHREESIKKSAEWNKNNPKKHSLSNFKSHLKRIGWTWEEYIKAQEEQENLCAICKRPNRQKGRPLHADHDHVTGIKRELLCSPCNTGLGSFYDNPELLIEAILYLRRHSL